MNTATTINDRAGRAYAKVMLMEMAVAGQVSRYGRDNEITLLHVLAHDLAVVREDLLCITHAESQAPAPTDEERVEMERAKGRHVHGRRGRRD